MKDQREILDQLALCVRLISDASKLDALTEAQRTKTQISLSLWQENLTTLMAWNASVAGASIRDIPDEPDPKKRALALWPTISACVDDLDDSPSDNTKRFLLHVAWHEGDKLRTRVQYNGGPGKSFFQFEAYRAKEALQYARQKGYADQLATASGKTKKELQTGEDGLPDYDPNDSSCSYFPDDNLIGQLLETNDPFGTYLARISLKKIPAAIGTTNSEHADYWYTHWKVSGGDPAKLKATFKQEADDVDNLISIFLASSA